jgi:hypothetical protein
MSNYSTPRPFDDHSYSDEENGKYYLDLHKRYQKYLGRDFGPEAEAWTMDPPKAIVRIPPVNSNSEPNFIADIQEPIEGTAPTTEILASTEEPDPKVKNTDDVIGVDVLGRDFRPLQAWKGELILTDNYSLNNTQKQQ